MEARGSRAALKSTAALKAVAIVWLAVTGLQFVVWGVMCAVTVSFGHAPFWLWSLAGGAVVVLPWFLIVRGKANEARS